MFAGGLLLLCGTVSPGVARRRVACHIFSMVIFAMTVSADGFITDESGGIDWSSPSDELLQAHLERVSRLSAYLLGRKLYETMLPWETDPSMRETPENAAFADVWQALPKVVFSSSLPQLHGNARLARGSVAEEIALATASGGDVEIGGATLAGQALELDLIDEFRMFRAPVILGRGTRYFSEISLLSAAKTLPLELLELRTFSDIVYERYGRVRI